MTFTAITRLPAYQQVARQLRDAIATGVLVAGELLPTERDLAGQFDVSRTTVREALRALSAQGLIVASGRARLRFCVAPSGMSDEALRAALGDLVEMRHASLRDVVDLLSTLEGAAVERAALTPDPEQLALARYALESMRRPEISDAAFNDADLRFHVALINASGNVAMSLVMRATRDEVARCALETLERAESSAGTRAHLIAQHAAILDAVLTGDGPQARTLVQEHIAGFFDRVVDTATRSA